MFGLGISRMVCGVVEMGVEEYGVAFDRRAYVALGGVVAAVVGL